MIGFYMDTLGLIFYFITVLSIPFLFQFLCRQFKFFDFLGITICCFLMGTIVGNLYPHDWIEKDIINEVNNIIVPIGIILMLFTTNLKKWINLSVKVLFAYLLGIIGAVLLSILLFFVFGKGAELPLVSGMLTGTYVGGTPNMAAVKIAFGINEELYNQIFLCDTIASSIYLIFVMVFAQKMLGCILKKYRQLENVKGEKVTANIVDHSTLTKAALSIIEGICFSVLVFLVPIGLWFLFTRSMENMSMVFVILAITMLAVLLSFVPKIRNNGWNFRTGDYLFSVFFTFLGTLTYFKDMVNINPTFLLFTFIILFGSVFIHIILCKIFRIDRDTMIITSAAGIMSPPFIPAISNAIKNKDLMAPGIAVGIVGLALGNMLGIFVVKLLLRFV